MFFCKAIEDILVIEEGGPAGIVRARLSLEYILLKVADEVAHVVVLGMLRENNNLHVDVRRCDGQSL